MTDLSDAGKQQREELVDDIRDTMSDTCDMDVSFSQYAEAVVKMLEKRGLLQHQINSAILDKIKAMETAEMLMRDQYRRAGHLSDDMYKLHGDRAQAFRDAARVIEAMGGCPCGGDL